MVYVLLYFAAIVLANLITGKIGPSAAPYVAFALIGADLTLRDKIHDTLHGDRLFGFKMAGLILTACGLSLLFGGSVSKVALASAAAFVAASTVDAIVYHLAGSLDPTKRVRLSNLASAATDSAIFPYLAFGGFPIALMAVQFIAKTAGSELWRVILKQARKTDWSARRRVTPS